MNFGKRRKNMKDKEPFLCSKEAGIMMVIILSLLLALFQYL